jgi:hypothetical protein
MKNPFIKQKKDGYFTVAVVDAVRVAWAAGSAALVLVLFTAAMLLGFGGRAYSTDTTGITATTAVSVVEHTSTTVTSVDTVPVVDTVPTGTQYVCDMPASYSEEYSFTKWNNGDLVYLNAPAVLADTIVFTWNVDFSMEMRNTFAKNVAEVGVSVGKEMRIEDSGYFPVKGELIVPIVNGSTIKEFENREYGAAIWTTNSFLFGVEYSFVINDNYEDIEGMIQEYGRQVIFHELGHLFGLEHTHVHDDGIDQVDSIMSYEHVWFAEGWEAGDIAGLQKIFCGH